MPNKNQIAEWFQHLQSDICKSLETLDGKGKFLTDQWTRPGGGGGITRVITKGALIEKGGVNFSQVHGNTPQKILNALQLEESEFFASGVSIVLHPESPMVPIIHMNVRYFEMSSGHWWFGGGIDLTPHYVDHEDAKFFHNQLKTACDQYDLSYYPKFKNWADDYFFIKHRKETRGIGGIFFDQLNDTTYSNKSKSELFEFVKSIGTSFVPTYEHLAVSNRTKSYDQKEKDWQLLRRGRYVEFNLVWDRGTKFGLDTDGRTESILMSLPEQANWSYNHQVDPNSKEAETQSLLKKGINWI